MTTPETPLRLHDRVEFLQYIANRNGIVFYPWDEAIISAIYGDFCRVEDPRL